MFKPILPFFTIFYKSVTDGPTDRRTDGPTDQRTNGRTHPLIEMLGASKNAYSPYTYAYAYAYGDRIFKYVFCNSY